MGGGIVHDGDSCKEETHGQEGARCRPACCQEGEGSEEKSSLREAFTELPNG